MLCCAVFIYVGLTTSSALHTQLDNQSTTDMNYTKILSESIDKIPTSYYVLRWGSFVLIIGMCLSIFIGSYLVTTKPIFFVPYIIVLFVAVIFSVIIANTYETLLQDSVLGAVLASFTGSNFLMLNLPIVVSVVGLVGGAIMYGSYKIGGGNEFQ